MKLIARDTLVHSLQQHRDTPEVKVLTGVRRCGKSTLLSMYGQTLQDQGVPQENVIVRRLDSFAVPIGYSAIDLQKDLEAAFATAKPGPCYVFLDEIQDVDGWEQVVRRLHTRPHTDVYVTGSNAYLLSGDLATHLAGRYVTIPVFPLSFAEYWGFRQEISEEVSVDAAFGDFLQFGGMPGLFAMGLSDRQRATEVLTAIYDSVIVRDVAGRYQIRDLAALEKISQYLFSTSGNLFSTNNVVNALKNAGATISYQTVDNLIDALRKAFIIYSADQERIKGKALLRPLRKFYPVDNGLRNLTHGFSGADLGAQLEGALFMELQYRGYSVSVGTLSAGEVDFIARRGTEKLYIQVTLSMLDESTRQRELKPLRDIDDAFPRQVLTLDRFSDGVTPEGIQIHNATDWFLAE